MTDDLARTSIAAVERGASLAADPGDVLRRQERSARRAKVACGLCAAIATFAPVVMSVHGSRSR